MLVNNIRVYFETENGEWGIRPVVKGTRFPVLFGSESMAASWLEDSGLMILNDFVITFTDKGWGVKPAVDGVELCESFDSKEDAIEWLKTKDLTWERQFAKAQLSWDYMADE